MKAANAYPPLTARHKAVFAGAALLVVLVGFAFAIARMRLIGWLLGHCNSLRSACSLALTLINYWWVAFIAVVLVITLAAHLLTKSRIPLRGESDAKGRNMT